MSEGKELDDSNLVFFSQINEPLFNNVQMSRIIKKPDISLCENKGADQLCSKHILHS